MFKIVKKEAPIYLIKLISKIKQRTRNSHQVAAVEQIVSSIFPPFILLIGSI